MADEKVTRLGVRPKDPEPPAPGEGLRPLGLTIKAIRHQLLAKRQAAFANKVLPFKPRSK